MSIQTIDTQADAVGKRFAIVVSRYNDYLTRQLLSAAQNTLLHHGAAPQDLLVVWVPGSDETPLAAEKIARSHKTVDAIIALGVVVEGETAHAGIITRHCSDTFSRISSTYDIPVINGIVTARSTAQAVARAEVRGEHFAMAAIHMAKLFETLVQRDMPERF